MSYISVTLGTTLPSSGSGGSGGSGGGSGSGGSSAGGAASLGNVGIGMVNTADGGTITGGNWTTAQPISRVQDYRPSVRARSVSAGTGDTWFQVTRDSTFGRTDVVSITGHNLSSSATWRVRVGTLANITSSPEFDSGSVNVWPTNAQGYGLLERSRLTGHACVIVPGATGPVIRVDVSDASNPQGFIELGRLWVGPLWQPVYNVEWGVKFDFDDGTEMREAHNRADYALVRSVRRVTEVQFAMLLGGECFEALQPLSLGGESRQCLWLFNPTDAGDLLRKGYLARVQKGSALTMAKPMWDTASFRFVEVVA